MKQTRFVLSLILLVVFMLTQVTLANSEGKDKSGKLAGWHSHTAKELKMTDEQVQQYKALIATKQAAYAKWQEEYGSAYKAAHQALKKAKAAGDKEAYKAAKKDYEAAKAGKLAAGKAYETGFDALLTPEQKGIKAGMGLYNSINWMCKKSGLKMTDAQNAKIREMAYAKGAEIIALKGKSHKVQKQAKHEFKQQIIDQVLTDEQKAALETHHANKSHKAKAEKSEHKAKKLKKEQTEKD